MNDHLLWRYTTKKFDPLKKISDQEFQGLLEVLRLAPSSFGLQPWKFVVVESPNIRRLILDHAWGQSQVVDASHLIVVCALTSIDEEYIRKYITRLAEGRGVGLEALASYERSMRDYVRTQTRDEIQQWMKRQVYIPLGMLLSECAHRKIDACPMEGFDGPKVDDTLELKAEGVTAVALCPIGYRSADDKYAMIKKVRFDAKDLFIFR